MFKQALLAQLEEHQVYTLGVGSSNLSKGTTIGILNPVVSNNRIAVPKKKKTTYFYRFFFPEALFPLNAQGEKRKNVEELDLLCFIVYTGSCTASRER